MTILEKVYKESRDNALEDIIKSYKKNSHLVVNYIYFANLISNGIISGKNVNKDYLDALKSGDYLLPDGIALQLYYKKIFSIDLPNLNGTDFGDFLLKNLNKNDFNLVLYGAKKEVITKVESVLKSKYEIDVFYSQDGYSEFDFSKIEELKKSKEKINILMVGLGTPKQEIWVNDNLDKLKDYHLLTFSQGGTFDFWAGNEKRAPKIFLDLKLEWLFRFITNPKKNFKKVFNSLYLFWYLFKK